MEGDGPPLNPHRDAQILRDKEAAVRFEAMGGTTKSMRLDPATDTRKMNPSLAESGYEAFKQWTTTSSTLWGLRPKPVEVPEPETRELYEDVPGEYEYVIIQPQWDQWMYRFGVDTPHGGPHGGRGAPTSKWGYFQ